MTALLDHQRARELDSHKQRVYEIQRRARQWRLMDCDEPTLDRMRHALIDEMTELERRLEAEDERFGEYVALSQPLETEQSLRAINRLSAEWTGLNTHLQEIDRALLERHLRTRLIKLFGGTRRLLIWDGLIFFSIIVALVLIVLEAVLSLSTATLNLLINIDTAICGLLLVDFFTRLWLAEDRRWYFRTYWIDLVASIPFTGPLRFGRVVRLTRLLRFARLLWLARALRVVTFSFRGVDKLGQTFQLNLLRRSIVLAAVLLLIGAFALQGLENGVPVPEAGVAAERFDVIGDLENTFWWSFTTVVTGGFADLYNPQTTGGRLLTVGLVLLGLVVTGIFTASLTSVLVEDDASRIEQAQYELEGALQGINSKLDLVTSETNAGLIALEAVAQEVSHRESAAAVAQILAQSMVNHFECRQASVHLLNGVRQLTRIVQVGEADAAPPARIQLGEGFVGDVADRLLRQDLRTIDIEPVTTDDLRLDGTRMVCPLVAHGRLFGVLHVLLPTRQARYYLYNRAPMTLAHHAALALETAELREKVI